MTILVAEDDPNTRNGLVDILEGEGYSTISAENGKDAIKKYEEENPDILCLDIMMPLVNGYDVCRKVRESDPKIPILFISAKSEEIDKVLGLEIGADDYIVKPFGVKEVIARIRAVTRRYLMTKDEDRELNLDSFQMADLEVIPSELKAYRNETIIDLGLRDVKILTLLYKNTGKVVDRNTIFNECWGLNYLASSRTLDQHISQLRKKIELDPKVPAIIHTVHNAGYRFEA